MQYVVYFLRHCCSKTKKHYDRASCFYIISINCPSVPARILLCSNLVSLNIDTIT